MKNTIISIVMFLMAGCGTVEQAKKDFNNFKKTIVIYNNTKDYSWTNRNK